MDGDCLHQNTPDLHRIDPAVAKTSHRTFRQDHGERVLLSSGRENEGARSLRDALPPETSHGPANGEGLRGIAEVPRHQPEVTPVGRISASRVAHETVPHVGFRAQDDVAGALGVRIDLDVSQLDLVCLGARGREEEEMCDVDA